ncbi:MAG: hypothetical protein M3Z46_10465, partial [Actinomycetota bacterium]|nr:hypothetical protein [Actinomycetota bacterium]
MATPLELIDPLFEDPADAEAMLRLCRDFGPYHQYAVEESEVALGGLPQRFDSAFNFVTTGGRLGRVEEPNTAIARTSYFRESYAYGGRIMAPGIESFLHHPALIGAARRIHGREVVVPAIAYANLLLPGQELAVHTDVPEFRGADRRRYPQWLMVVMLHSGLFDAWRMPIATGVSYFGAAAGGALSFWPDGADGPVRLIEPRHNTAVVTDTDRAFHGVDRVGSNDTAPPPIEAGMVMDPREDGGWTLRLGDAPTETYGPDEVRFSVSWKAYCFADEDEHEAWRTHSDDLTLDQI